MILWDESEKMSIHSWICNNKSGTFCPGLRKSSLTMLLEVIVYQLAGKPKNVMLLTTTVPLLGVTKDDQKKKPGVYRRYDYRLASFVETRVHLFFISTNVILEFKR
jgi:hypothetical protein